MAAAIETREHPAKFSAPVIDAIRETLIELRPTGPLAPIRVLDPFAGVGGIHSLRDAWYETVGVEIEPEWAAASEHTVAGDATALEFADGSFDVVATSPCYGNRMADTYAGEPCADCDGGGLDPDNDGAFCGTCGGTGHNPTQRYTYRLSLGRPLSDGSAAALQWGPEYRALHEDAWREVRRVLPVGGLFLLNISDHIRGGQLQGVDLWHAATVGALGFALVESRPIQTRRQKNGANGELRASCEWLLVFRKCIA